MPSAFTSLATSRLTFGPRFMDLTGPSDTNFPTWLATQLAAPSTDYLLVMQRLAALQLPITLTNPDGTTTTESRGLTDLFESGPELWPLSSSTDTPDPAERRRPTDEVIAARWIRAAFSPYQIFEVMVDFWHNHFSVDAYGTSQASAMWPIYDQAIRTNALGNFRTLFGATAKSAAMMYFLNQAQSNKQQPNENYSREVMELHTLGIASYLGETTPPGAAGTGYSDQDVTQAARVLTGWTIADGHRKVADGTTPDDGSFIFSPALHDTGAKTVFTLNFPAGGGEAEGETLLDYLAIQPGTARNIATKLYVRFVGDTPPAGDPLVSAMAAAFTQNAAAPNQIALVLEVLINHPEFAASAGAKVKTPFELMIAQMRLTGCEINPSASLSNMLSQMGAPMFHWGAPNGMPDIAPVWTGTNDMLVRWTTTNQIADAGSGILQDGDGTLFQWCLDLTPPNAQGPGVRTPVQVAQLLLYALLPNASAATVAALQDYAESPEALGGHGTFASAATVEAGIRKLVGAIAASPEYQLR